MRRNIVLKLEVHRSILPLPLIFLIGCVPVKGDVLRDINLKVNREYAHIKNNCVAVAWEKKERLENLGKKGILKCIKVPEKYLPIKLHCYLEVDGYILDNGGLQQLIVK